MLPLASLPMRLWPLGGALWPLREHPPALPDRPAARWFRILSVFLLAIGTLKVALRS